MSYSLTEIYTVLTVLPCSMLDNSLSNQNLIYSQEKEELCNIRELLHFMENHSSLKHSEIILGILFFLHARVLGFL